MPRNSDTTANADPQTVAALRAARDLQWAIQRHDRAAIADLARQLTELRPAMGEQWLSLAHLVANNGEIALARKAADIYLSEEGETPAARFRKATLLTAVGAWAEAHAMLCALPPDVPDPASYAYTRGNAASLLGLVDEARHYLGEAVRLQPRWGVAWLALATLVDFAREPELAERIVAGEPAAMQASPHERAAYLHALGKARVDRGEHSQAFAAFASGAAVTRSLAPYDREQDRRLALDAISGYDAETIAAMAARQTEPTGRTIFVMGLPRSGTTLVEQILTSHSEVSDGAEINRLPMLIRDVGGLPYPALRAYYDKVGPPAVARLWDRWLDERFPGSRRVVDKTFTTTRLLSLAAAMLPEAPLIWVTRDPLDCAWSCFRTHFKTGAPWSYDLEDLAFHFRLDDELLARWREILGERLLVVSYEALVTDPEPWIRRILMHCGLAEERQAFAPHENPRPVTTASVMQVRQPINPRAIGSAEPYRRFLEPFIRAYYG